MSEEFIVIERAFSLAVKCGQQPSLVIYARELVDGEGEISHVSAEIALISRYDSWSPDNELCAYNKESPLSRVLPT